MVNWRLIRGMRPPLNNEEWRREFEKYKQYPEYKYKTVDREMTMNEFKFIWIMEYSHRMVARITGLFYLLPATVFWVKGYFSKRMKLPVVLGGSLLIFQGLLGWYMVKSGLDPTGNSNAAVPRVSQYRLAAHLTSAFALYGLLFWCGLSHLFPAGGLTGPGVSRLRILAGSTLVLTSLTAVVGAFVAGLDAGLVYNSWPKFSDRWVPTDLWALDPRWKNIFDNPTNVQFFHRNLAYATVLVALATFAVGRKLPLSRRTRVVLDNVLYVSCFQVALGVAALVYYVPAWLGSLHQINFMFLLSFATMLLHEVKRLPVK
ncbi:unnamed protein product [Soboliphyme baturini]|uniref:Cytochrome c oxidase assembly protein COX15 n=1 Tax=Soboliphyme baturini TaxID=241478 RepID=A0A183J9N6_9BILA|nr:unnamed protein product [Soboliphyme baturini]